VKLLYCGGTICDASTYKRLLMLADQIGFMDRPGVSFPKWGMIGMPSPARGLVQEMADTPIPVVVYSPPSGRIDDLYKRYIEADLADPQFRGVVLDGLNKNATFAAKLVQLDGEYGSMRQTDRYITRGSAVVRTLVDDEVLRHAPLSVEEIHGNMFGVRDDVGRRATLAALLTDASIQVTNAMLLSEESGLLPVTDDPFLSHLIALRAAQPYVGQVPARAPLIGMAVAQAVIPDEALQRLTIHDIIDYRKTTKDAYGAWSAELNRLAALIDDIPASEVEKRVSRLVTTEVAPKLHEYRNEMKSARDKLFGDLVKKVAGWEVPTVSFAYLLEMSLGTAALVFANALLPAIPAVVDYLQAIAQVERKNSMSYLIGLAKEVD
jgi:hypothetical protein